MHRPHRIAMTLATLPMATIAWAVPPANAPYNTDAQNSYVQDSTSDGVDTVNMVMCIMDKMAMDTQVNAGPYVAMVDHRKCEGSRRSSSSNSAGTSSGASALDLTMRAIVDVSRTDASSAMVGKIWIDMTEDGGQRAVFVRISATEAPSASNPFGVFRLDYCGKDPLNLAGACQFNGYINAKPTGGLDFYENSGSGDAVAMNLASSSTTSGAGNLRMSPNGQPAIDFAFAFDTGHFLRGDGAVQKCFSRSLANAGKSVWRYGTYDASTGDRLDATNPGFPVKVAYNGQTRYGFASYWGLFAGGLDFNALDDTQVASIVVTRESRGSQTGATYSVNRVQGKLTKMTRLTGTLDSIADLPIIAFGDIRTLTGDTQFNVGNDSVELHWDATAQQFVITGRQVCSGSGCGVQPLTAGNAPVPIPNNTSNAAFGIHGWSQSLGGEVNIPGKSSAYAGASDTASYFSQSVVVPGGAGAPASLYCLNNCLTSPSLAAFNGGNSPFNAVSQTQWGYGAQVLRYDFGTTGLTQHLQSSVLAMVNPAYATGAYQWGIRTGKLFPTPLPACTWNASLKCEPDTDYYIWETGPNNWNQYLALISGGQPVAFDPPLNVAFTPSTSNTNLPLAHPMLGKTMQLQFNGFGELQGIPGKCVNPVDNHPVACGTGGNERYVPAFAIADGTTLSIGGHTALVKYLDREVRLAEDAGQCTGLSLPTPAGLPTASALHDPSLGSDSFYNGARPTPASLIPKVIHGVVQ